MEVKASITIYLYFANILWIFVFPFPSSTMIFGFVFKLMFSQNGGERCSSGVLMRRAFHKPCALTPCAHSGAGGVASLATSLGPPAGVTAIHINFRMKQTSLWKTNFRAGSLNYIFNTRVSIISNSKSLENQIQNVQLARFSVHFWFSEFMFSLRGSYFFLWNLLVLSPWYNTGLHILLLSIFWDMFLLPPSPFHPLGGLISFFPSLQRKIPIAVRMQVFRHFH